MVSVSKSSPVRCSGRVATRKQSSDRSARSIEENGRQIILKVYLRKNLKRHKYALPPGLLLFPALRALAEEITSAARPPVPAAFRA